LIDYHIHALAHGEYNPDLDWYREYMLRAQALGIKEIGFSEHDEYWQQVKPEQIRSVAAQFAGMQIKVGLEMEFRHTESAELSKFLRQGDLDYVIGSVHFLGEWNFDHPEQSERFDCYPIESIYNQYFAELGLMINSHLFDIVGHLDLIKIGGLRPAKGINFWAEQLLPAIRQANMAVEINSGGLRKPIAELFPNPVLVARLYEANILLTMGSEADHPDQVGWEMSSCQQLIRKAGYRKLAAFTQRRMLLLSI